MESVLGKYVQHFIASSFSKNVLLVIPFYINHKRLRRRSEHWHEQSHCSPESTTCFLNPPRKDPLDTISRKTLNSKLQIPAALQEMTYNPNS